MEFLQNEEIEFCGEKIVQCKAPEDSCGRSPMFRHRCYLPGTSATPDKSSFFFCCLFLCSRGSAGVWLLMAVPSLQLLRNSGAGGSAWVNLINQIMFCYFSRCPSIRRVWLVSCSTSSWLSFITEFPKSLCMENLMYFAFLFTVEWAVQLLIHHRCIVV